MESLKEKVEPTIVPGMPEGVGLIVAETDLAKAYVLYGDRISGPCSVRKGALIAVPLEGYRFVYEINTDGISVARSFDSPKGLVAYFTVADDAEEARVRGLVSQLGGTVAQ